MQSLTSAPLTDPLRIYRYRDGLYAADLLTAGAVHLDFFNWLNANPSTKAECCAHYGFAERPVDVMLTLFTSMGLIEWRDEKHQTTDTAREHLTSGSPWNLTPYYASLKDRPVVQDFIKVLQTDQPAGWGGGGEQLDWHQAMETESFSRSFTAAMDCRGIYLGGVMARMLDLAAHRKVLDIGGGSGIYACSLAAHHPHLRACVFEQRPVDGIAAKCIEERGFSAQVQVATGDMFKNPLPVDCDVHLFSNVLHDWGVKEVRELLGISRKAIPDGGLLIIHDTFINAEKSGPLPVAEYSALLMHSTQGKCYSTAEYAALLQDAGFHAGEYRDTAADRGFMLARAV